LDLIFNPKLCVLQKKSLYLVCIVHKGPLLINWARQLRVICFVTPSTPGPRYEVPYVCTPAQRSW